MNRALRLVLALSALALLGAACSGDDGEDGEDSAATTTPATAKATTTSIPTVGVTYRFDTPLDRELAEQAASTMGRRLLKTFDLKAQSGAGTKVTVTSDGTGLDIAVPGVDSAEQVQDLVDGVSFRGDLYFRPAITEYPAPANTEATPAGLIASPPAEAVLASALAGAQNDAPTTSVPANPATSDPAGTTAATTATTTTAPADTTTTTAPPQAPTSVAPTTTLPEPPPLTPASEDDPNGNSVLPWRAFNSVDQLRAPDSAEIRSVWEVGPAALSGDVVENTEVTTYNGDPAVKVVLADGADGLDAFNAMAQSCFNADSSCPAGAYGVSLDSNLIVVSVPRGGDATFTPFSDDDVIIWSDNFTDDVVATLAVAIEAGALPTTITFAG